MKKIIDVIIAVIGIIFAALGINAKIKGAAAIGVIGGADGPTSVFIAGKVGDGFGLSIILAGIVLVIAGAIMIIKSKKK